MEFLDSAWFFALVVILALWDLAWKLVALWKSARNNQLVWFICLGVLNTVGILPIIYILLNRNRNEKITAR